MRKNLVATGLLTLLLMGCQAATDSSDSADQPNAVSANGGNRDGRGNREKRANNSRNQGDRVSAVGENSAADSFSSAPARVGGGMRKHEFPTEERFGATLVYFAKTICPSCAEQDGIYQNFIRSLPSGIKVRKVFEYEVDPDWYGIDHYPTMILFEDGREVWRRVGVNSEQVIRDAIMPYAGGENNLVR